MIDTRVLDLNEADLLKSLLNRLHDNPVTCDLTYDETNELLSKTTAADMARFHYADLRAFLDLLMELLGRG